MYIVFINDNFVVDMADKVRIHIDYQTARALHRCLHTAEEPPKVDLKQLRAGKVQVHRLSDGQGST